MQIYKYNNLNIQYYLIYNLALIVLLSLKLQTRSLFDPFEAKKPSLTVLNSNNVQT